MSKRSKKIIKIAIIIFALLIIFALFLSYKPIPEKIEYGVSFMAPYTRELGLDPQKVFIEILDDLGVQKLRLAAHWDNIEDKKDIYDFSDTDFQVREAEKRNAEIIFGVGRRLPRWPECHVPEWAREMNWEDQKNKIRELITKTIERYKDSPAIKYWQVENEPFLSVFGDEYCGNELDIEFLEEEIELVKELDPSRKVLLTDSGNLGSWNGAYKLGDAFGTSTYIYLWNPDVGQIRTILPPAWYRIKRNIMEILYGKKDSFLIELSLEPWLLEPIIDVPLNEQFKRMNIDKFDEIIEYAAKTSFKDQYLWGVEWWYWLKEQNMPEFWDKAREIYTKNDKI